MQNNEKNRNALKNKFIRCHGVKYYYNTIKRQEKQNKIKKNKFK